MEEMNTSTNDMTHIEMDFSSGLSLSWLVEKNEAANIWLKCLLMSLSANYLIKNRFVGFKNSFRDELFLMGQLNACIETINKSSDYSIAETYEIGADQAVLNSIHHHFSVLIGKEGEGSDFWQKSSSVVKSAICGLNDYVHEIEAFKRASDDSGAYCCIEFFEAEGVEIPSRLDGLFSLNLNFGDITLHYDQIGKTWLEVLIDKDESIIDEAIRPLNRITGSFNANFFSIEGSLLQENLLQRARQLKVDFNDEKLRLGQLKVASLIKAEKGFDEAKIIEGVGRSQEISAIRVFKDGNLIREKSLDGNLERYFDKVEWK